MVLTSLVLVTQTELWDLEETVIANHLAMESIAVDLWRIIAGIFGIPVFLLCLCILVSEFIRCFNELKSYWYEKRS